MEEMKAGGTYEKYKLIFSVTYSEINQDDLT